MYRVAKPLWSLLKNFSLLQMMESKMVVAVVLLSLLAILPTGSWARGKTTSASRASQLVLASMCLLAN